MLADGGCSCSKLLEYGGCMVARVSLSLLTGTGLHNARLLSLALQPAGCRLTAIDDLTLSLVAFMSTHVWH
jgi:hypothetical protein